jgi:hypothetical protein
MSKSNGTARVVKGANVELNSAVELGKIGVIKKTRLESGDDANIKEWGDTNEAPNKRETLLRSTVVPQALINTKRNLTVGLDLECYVERVEKRPTGNVVIQDAVIIPDDIKAFYEASGGKKYFREAANDLFINANVFTEFLPDVGTMAGTRKSGKYARVKLQKSRYMRAEQMNDDGIVERFFWRGDAWVKRSDEKKTFLAKPISAYRADLPLEEQDTEGFVYHTGDELFFDEYYYIPGWEGTSELMRLSLLFPDFHHANLKNGLGVQHHVEIFSELLDSVSNEPSFDEAEKQLSDDKRATKKSEVVQAVTDFATGVKNQGRLLITEYTIDDQSRKEISDVRITPIKNELKDESLIKLWEEIIKAIMSAFQVHPTLANVETAGRLSSGTEMRNAYLMWLIIHASTFRDIILEPFYIAQKLNGWDPNIKFRFKDAVLTTLSDNPTGKKTDTGA